MNSLRDARSIRRGLGRFIREECQFSADIYGANWQLCVKDAGKSNAGKNEKSGGGRKPTEQHEYTSTEIDLHSIYSKLYRSATSFESVVAGKFTITYNVYN